MNDALDYNDIVARRRICLSDSRNLASLAYRACNVDSEQLASIWTIERRRLQLVGFEECRIGHDKALAVKVFDQNPKARGGAVMETTASWMQKWRFKLS